MQLRRLFFCLILATSTLSIAQSKELRITRITPEGSNVASARQIVIEFNRQVVPIGKMQRSSAEIPVEIKPSLHCQWRWLNTSTLACNLDEQDAFKPSTRYDLHVKPGIKAQDGATLNQIYDHFFITTQADIRSAWIDHWAKPGSPVIKLRTNLPVTAKSLEHHILFTDGKNKPLSTVKIVPDVDTAEEESDEETPTPAPAKKFNNQDWIVLTEKELPLNQEFNLHLEPGLKTLPGAEASTASRDLLTSHSFPEFEFIGISCQTNDEKQVLITAEHPQSPKELCNQLAPISLVFNTPVSKQQIKDHLVFSPALPGSKGQDIWEIDEEEDVNEVSGEHAADAEYHVWLPWTKAAQQYKVTVKPANLSFLERIKNWFSPQAATDLSDNFGRKMFKPFSIQFATDHRKPNFVLTYHAAVLEKNTDSEIPLYVNNLSEITLNYRSIGIDSSNTGQLSQKVPTVPDIQFAIPLGIRSLFPQGSGALYGAISTVPKVDKTGDDSHLFAEITPFQVQAKIGHFNSLIWVTDFSSGQAVANAKVTVYSDKYTTLGQPHSILATATTNEQGVALLPGNDVLDPELTLSRGWDDNNSRLFVRVDKDQDMALLPIAQDFIIDTWRVSDGKVSDNPKPLDGHLSAWGFTAQGIYRAGDNIQYQFYVRNQNNQTLTPPPDAAYTLEIIDPTDKVVGRVDNISLSQFGAYNGEFQLPKSAAIGWYQFRLTVDFSDSETMATKENVAANERANNQLRIVTYPMRVLVSDFTPAPFKVSTELNGDQFQPGQSIEVDTSAKLHSGGPYTDAQARITANLEGQAFTSKDPQAEDFIFSSEDNYGNSRQIYQQRAPLNDKGEVTSQFSIPAQKNLLYGRLTVESAVQDERGKYIAAQSQADYVGVDRFVGLKPTQWVYNARQPASINYVVVDSRGKLTADSPVSINIEQQVTTAAKIKDAGNAYTTHYSSTWQSTAHCQGKSGLQPQTCSFTPQSAGDYRLTATTKDSKGRTATSQTRIWVTGQDYVLWNEDNDNYLQIIPEKTSYQVGDSARFIIKNPYPGSLALITVERYGILEQHVQAFSDSSPIIEVPIKPDYLPGVYLSVTVFSPRVNKPLQQGQIDLGKPSFKMGYVSLPVNDPYKEIQVTATPDQPVYRPRDVVTVKLHAQTKMPMATAEPIQLAVVVLDEAVFDLLSAGKTYYDPYQGFYRMADLDLRNYSLLTRLIGRQKFEKKGANPGGDGGVDLGLRNLFKFISYWNPAVPTDSNGNATVQFSAPDNLTGWRILALAVTPGDRLGLGDGNFKVNRPTELRPILPNQVTEGDQFQAGFSVLNRSAQSRELTVTLQASGDIKSAQDTGLTTKITLAPYKKVLLWFPVQASSLTTNRSVSTGQIVFTAQAGDASDRDAVSVSLPVEKMRSLETAADYGTTTENAVSQSLLIPAQIYPDSGQIKVNLAPSVIADVTGAFQYMKDYPYSCWEQKLSKGVMAINYQQLKPYLGDFSWPASTALPQTTLTEASNFQAPNGGMAYYQPQNSYSDPYLSAFTALGFNWMQRAGLSIPLDVAEKLQRYLKTYLRRDTAPDYYSVAMNASVRAVALAALAEQGQISKTDLERFQTSLPQMSLFGQAHYLLAALQLGNAQELAISTAQLILSHANETGGSISFTETNDDSYERILGSPLRDNCAVLSAFTALAKTEEGKTLVGDLPFKLLRSIIASRKNRDHWENTQENLFCSQALNDYRIAYEATIPNMTVTAQLNNQTLGISEFKQLTAPPTSFIQPLTSNELGKAATVNLSRQGEGRLYYSTQLSYASLAKFDQPSNAGMEIHREYSVYRQGHWVLLTPAMPLQKGEVLRADIYLSLPAVRNFVVVNDPIPGGLEPINRDLATASTVDAADSSPFTPPAGSVWYKFKNWTDYDAGRWSFYHQELRNNAAQFYSDYLPAGNYHLTYMTQAIASGKFMVMPVLAEEMYDPDVYGKGVGRELVIAPPSN